MATLHGREKCFLPVEDCSFINITLSLKQAEKMLMLKAVIMLLLIFFHIFEYYIKYININ